MDDLNFSGSSGALLNARLVLEDSWNNEETYTINF